MVLSKKFRKNRILTILITNHFPRLKLVMHFMNESKIRVRLNLFCEWKRKKNFYYIINDYSVDKYEDKSNLKATCSEMKWKVGVWNTGNPILGKRKKNLKIISRQWNHPQKRLHLLHLLHCKYCSFYGMQPDCSP